MTKKIFRSILLVSAVVLLASLVVVVACMYRFSADAQERQIHDDLSLAAARSKRRARAIYPKSPIPATA